MRINKIKTGKKGEKIACNYLIKNGYSILQKNFKNNIGEIDIIAKYGSIIVFVEVKSRNNTTYGYAYEAVTYNKRRKIIKTAKSYIRFNKIDNTQFRFDIIEVYFNKKKKINHIENAFWIE